jgi:imidazolonepropionase-like amidohydrolase
MSRATFACCAALIATITADVASAAERTLIRGATVHTLGTAGTLEGADVLVEDGRIVSVGAGITAPAGTNVIDAKGKVVTPGFFGGISYLGLQEIGLEPTAEDYALRMDAMRPEFDVAPAFNPDTVASAVNRIDGVTFTLISPDALPGLRGGPNGSIVAGQAAVVALDGRGALPARALLVDLGGDTNVLAGGSRAGDFMLLRQALTEARTPGLVLAHDQRLLTPAGRQVLLDYLKGAQPVLFEVDRAADIRETLAFMKREGIPRGAIVGGAEGWRVATELAAAKVPVFLDPLENLPAGFDSVGATLENAARLHAAGVRIAFTFRSGEPHNIRRLRQAAGNAVAHGLPHAAALAALTQSPAQILGVADRFGTLEAGRPADLVLWSGDPLEVTTVAQHVYVAGQPQRMRSRQTELRDRYLQKVRTHTAR